MKSLEDKIAVLFVCMGNICRSPTAEGVFRHKVEAGGLSDRFHIDSAGTHAYHIGEPPDRRSQATALERGYDLSLQKARKVSDFDFHEFDYIVAMDSDNLSRLKDQQPPNGRAKLSLMLDYSDSAKGADVPDPYYGGPQGFSHVLDLVEEAAERLLEQCQRT